ncbi:hypothetical protein [Streptosporangium saharense]|uniref:hypothetical protein n=1 Tax=Streptosporangium saharense TaxID=1706840 RepID=UPI003689EAB4
MHAHFPPHLLDLGPGGEGPLGAGDDDAADAGVAVERLRDCLRRHEVFVPGLPKWGDPTNDLLTSEAWDKAHPMVCRDPDLSAPASPAVNGSAMLRRVTTADSGS